VQLHKVIIETPRRNDRMGVKPTTDAARLLRLTMLLLLGMIAMASQLKLHSDTGTHR